MSPHRMVQGVRADSFRASAEVAQFCGLSVSRVISKNSNLVFAKVGDAPLPASPSIHSAFGLALVFFAKTENKCARFLFIIVPLLRDRTKTILMFSFTNPPMRENFLLPKFSRKIFKREIYIHLRGIKNYFL